MRKKILLLGSTGSLGQQTLEIIEEFPDDFELVGLSAHSNVDLLLQQCKKFNPVAACISNSNKSWKDQSFEVNQLQTYSSAEGLCEMVRHSDADLVVNNIVGAAGLLPTIEAIESGKDIALSNKETLVVAGEIVISRVYEKGIQLFPIDSEHSAIWQCLLGEKREDVKRIVLTASGGPFVSRKSDSFDSITVDEALDHPNWKMGKKITIDSGTLMNKGLEVIETHWLFGVQPENIEVVIHRQSIIHSMVEFVDGSVKAQLGIPDMKIPIQFAMTYPDRKKTKTHNDSLLSQMDLTFEPPDKDRFPCLDFAYQALKTGGTAPAVLNAANEIAVHHFLNGTIKFSEIPELIDDVLQQHITKYKPTLEDCLAADQWARQITQQKVLCYD